MGLSFLKQFAIMAVLTVGHCNLSWAQAKTFFDYSPASTRISGVEYPRKQNHLYRGTSDAQMDLAKATRAMLGDKSAVTESLFFSTIKNELMAVTFPPAVELTGYLHQQIQILIQKNNGPLSLTAAITATKTLVDNTFSYYDQKDIAVPSYVNYRSGSYIDWPNDIVFTTMLSPLAGTYGDRVLVVNEKKPRSLDLNFWNYVNNQTWYDHTRDIGEFISFGYLPSEDLAGYQVRTGSSKSWHQIQFAVYRTMDPTTNSLLVFTGLKGDRDLSSCIDLNSSNKTYYHCEFTDGQLVTSRPPLSAEKVKLSGVLSLCANDQESSCAKPTVAELTKYPKASLPASLVQEIQRAIKGLKVHGQSVKFLPL